MPHMTLSDVNLGELVIPSNTLLIINLWSGSRDKETWGDNAEEFDPHRFLLSNGQVRLA